MSGREIDVITFDLDDTLWAVGPVIIEAEKALWKWLDEHCPKMTARYDREKLMPLRGAVIEREPHLKHDISSMRTRVLTEALSRTGHGEESEALAKTAFDVFMHERHAVEYFEHVLPVLERLQKDFRLGVISNGNADVYRLDIGRFFEFAIAAGDVGASKPNRVVFVAALEAAQCAPEQIIHIGDNHEADIAGAHAMGMATVWVNLKGIRYPGGPKPDGEITSLDELPDAIHKIANG